MATETLTQRPQGAALVSAGPFSICGTFTPEDDGPSTVMVGWFASDAACAREAARNGLDPAEVIAFRDERSQHPNRAHRGHHG